MKCYAGCGLGLGYTLTNQTPISHIYTPSTPTHTPAHYLRIYDHGPNQHDTHNKKHTSNVGGAWTVANGADSRGGTLWFGRTQKEGT